MYRLPSDLSQSVGASHQHTLLALNAFPKESNPPLQLAEQQPPIMACLLKALEGLAQGMALLREDSLLLYSNTAAQCILREIGWSLEDGKVLSTKQVERDTWLKALRLASQKQIRSLIELSLKDGSVFVATMSITVDGETLVLANFGPQAASTQLALQLFANHHRLTSAEIEVLEKLAQGIKPQRIAALHHVALSTINSHLASIRIKTRCASVNEILVKLSHLPTLRPAGMLGASVNMFG